MKSTHSAPSTGSRLAQCALLGVLAGCSRHAHPTGDAAQAADHEPEPVAVTHFTERIELFMEYPRLTPGVEGRFLAHVTVLATGEPVRSGTLTIELRSPGGAVATFEAPQPARDGLFIPLVSLPDPGSYEARVLVRSEQVQDTVVLQPIVVHADAVEARDAAAAAQAPEPKDAVPFLLEQQWPIGLLLEQVRTRTLVQRLQVPGEIEAPQGAAAVVSAPLAGRIVPPESGRLPRLGEQVEKGQVLAFLELPLSTSDLAQRAANAIGAESLAVDLLIREFDLEASVLEIERSRFQSQARLEFANQALARLESLRAQGLGTQAELEAARRDVAIAEREQSAAQALTGSIGLARQKLAELRDHEPGASHGPTGVQALRVPVIAPISGEVVAVEYVEGEHVEAHGAIYRVLDLERAWIKVHVSEFDLHALGGTPGALLVLAADPGRTYDVLRDLDGSLASVGRVVDPQTRTVPLRYEVANPDGMLRVGMFAEVFLETATAVDAVALPREAVVMDGGRPVAFVLLEGELFQKRLLELGLQDGSWVQILSGVVPGERVATRGAYLVKLAAASPASFGEGHAH